MGFSIDSFLIGLYELFMEQNRYLGCSFHFMKSRNVSYKKW